MARGWAGPAAALAAAAFLGACEDGRPAENVRHISVANPHSERLAAMSDEMRRLGLMRAVRDSGKRCQRVEADAFQEEYRDLSMWVARCEDGRAWGVFIAPNGDIQVRGCDEHAQLGLPECRLEEAAAQPASTS